MLFHSLAFALLLASVLVLDRAVRRLVPGRAGWNLRCGVYLAASLVFYAWWDPGRDPPAWVAGAEGPAGAVLGALFRVRYVGLMCASILFDFWVSRRLGAETRDGRRKLLLAASVTLQLGILATFKYWNFLRDSAAAAGPLAGIAAVLPRSDLVLPVGISFYTFQSMSYTIDVYRRVIPPERNLRVFALFVAFFPQLVAGPIVRARDFLWQVQVPKIPKSPRLLAGLERFALGLFKKIAVADNLTPLTDPVFHDPRHFCAANNAAALLLWGVVIYCDFSGYSDMAIGCARMLGFKFLENFHYPYLARTVTEFWRRWHLSLSTWLRDYLYIPLGGNRKGPRRTYVHLAATMLLGGLWHGASWNFVLWGGLHGGALALERAVTPERLYGRLPGPLRTAIVFGFVTLAWIPFRAKDFPATLDFLARLFGLREATPSASLLPGLLHSPYLVLSFLAAAAVVWGAQQSWTWTRELTPVRASASLALLTLALAALATQRFNPFIYFIF